MNEKYCFKQRIVESRAEYVRLVSKAQRISQGNTESATNLYKSKKCCILLVRNVVDG